MKRATLFESLDGEDRANLYCSASELVNEAAVEQFFVTRMLEDLGYDDKHIKVKRSISDLGVFLGRKRINYKPDYALVVGGRPRWVIDAKGPEEELDDWVGQCAGYCLAANREYSEEDPVTHFLLTNGSQTRAYKWNEPEPIVILGFPDFAQGSAAYETLRDILGLNAVLGRLKTGGEQVEAGFTLTKPDIARLRQLFVKCHNVIWKAEKMGPAPAFMEFAKLIFVKLYADRNLRQDEDTARRIEAGLPIDGSRVRFSTSWIEELEGEHENPLDAIQFQTLARRIEREIEGKKRKRIFDTGEQLRLKGETVKTVVRELEGYDLFGLDEDLNGRLFETFLAATMRGKELGQFFTPRSVVHLMVAVADLRAGRDGIDRVLDACCGTGGFLVEAMTAMRDRIRANRSMTDSEQESLMERIANECIFGIDAGSDPLLARLARMNMYLHNDGGSRIYLADALDQEFAVEAGDSEEARANKEELQRVLDEMKAGFSVVLTNPPFSMDYRYKAEDERRILLQYDLAYGGRKPGDPRRRLRSSAMFLERYHELLVPGGKLLTVIDDTVLANPEFKFVREYIRDRYVIKAIISLPGNAFRRSGSRVKTSILYLQKKTRDDEDTSAVFGAFSRHLGVDDLPARASQAAVTRGREQALRETEEIVACFEAFMNGEDGGIVLSREQVEDRLDLKYCVNDRGRLVGGWREEGIEVKSLAELGKVKTETINPQEEPDVEFDIMRVTYDGECVIFETRLGCDIPDKSMIVVSSGDLVLSKVRATDGAVGIVAPELEGALVSNSSFVVLQCGSEDDAVYLWAILRSRELRADLQALSTGSTRYTSPWDAMKELEIPYPPASRRAEVVAGLREARRLAEEARQCFLEAMKPVQALGVESAQSRERFERSKAPT